MREPDATPPTRSAPAIVKEDLAIEPLHVTDGARVAAIVGKLWNGGEVEPSDNLPPRFRGPAQPIFVAARSGGRLLAQSWQAGTGSTLDELEAAIHRVRSELGEENAAAIDTLQLDFTHSYREVDFRWLLQPSYTVVTLYGTARLK
jgi:hypothetical protein